MQKLVRRIPFDEWVKFRIKSLYYGIQHPTYLLTLIIQEEVMAFEGQGDLLAQQRRPITLDDLGPLNFTPRIPEPIYQAFKIIAAAKGAPSRKKSRATASRETIR